MDASRKLRKPELVTKPLTPYEIKLRNYAAMIEDGDLKSESTDTERIALGACLEMLQNENAFGTPFEKFIHDLIWGYIFDKNNLPQVAREASEEFTSNVDYVRDISESFSRRYVDRAEAA